jgi:hypothetical protein
VGDLKQTLDAIYVELTMKPKIGGSFWRFGTVLVRWAFGMARK